jgi:hypothetical protein
LCALAAACGTEPVEPDAGTPDQSGPCILPAVTLNVATLGGCRLPGTDDGPRGRARFDNPSGVALGPNGVAYILDAGSSRLRIIDPSGETITLVQRADFRGPAGIAATSSGTVFVATEVGDTGDPSPTSGAIWRVETSGDAQLLARDVGRPRGLAVLADGRIAMADPVHHTLSILDPTTRMVAPLAGTPDQAGYQNGTGAAALFAKPTDLVLLPDGDLAVSDLDNHRIRRVTLAGVVTDLAGDGTAGNLDGPAAVATFDAPHSLAVTPAGVLYVGDVRRNFIRRIATGVVTTVAGDGGRGWLDADLPRNAKFSGLEGMDASGSRLVVADGNRGDGANYHHVRVIALSAL